MPPSLPPWLSRAYSVSNIDLVLKTLAERESQRDNFRYQAQISPPSPGKASSDHYSVVAANIQRNVQYNRYRDIVPYDRTRAIVHSDSGDRYLNANWVLERCGHKWWIATQAPLPTTAHAFFSLIMQPVTKPHASLPHDTSYIRTVVQLTRNVEMGRTKAHVYFPSQVGESIVIPPEQGLPLLPLKVTLLQTRSHEDAQCIQSTVAIRPIDSSTANIGAGENIRYDGDDKQYIFQHLMYTAWPDHGVPEDKDRDSLLAFLKLVDRTNRDTSLCNYPSMAAPTSQIDPDPPMIVGCSAGIGRTGTFIALSSLLRQTKFLPPAVNPTPPSVISPSPLDAFPVALAWDLVAVEIDFLREQRLRMVERPEQILLVYEILIAVSQNT
ncbi:hypothetical protein AGABI2DRAFT_197155 [Agaricus bisporus var. bisporus H97]|uniref:hypothetical protein n=1 Tax=Agaricus bisporus var. bisporus (strain H97 / ATCC MYA-4626 / FGSC 10389) TaxID=936046 RepID=UPI00029F7E53|nr:hypothetical protein AGABI2DRAFT_197155 [Agaricus bisporus var. bisporus H97]EKV51280.1 hypothetical protein AGABI2DRAFT_197155 [Agaricus bisporus var. bisporus H97]